MENKEQTEISVQGAVNQGVMDFMTFCQTYPMDWIERIWEGNLANHLREKFKAIYSTHGYVAAPYRFYFELSKDNQDKLISFAVDNMQSQRDELKPKPKYFVLQTGYDCDGFNSGDITVFEDEEEAKAYHQNQCEWSDGMGYHLTTDMKEAESYCQLYDLDLEDYL